MPAQETVSVLLAADVLRACLLRARIGAGTRSRARDLLITYQLHAAGQNYYTNCTAVSFGHRMGTRWAPRQFVGGRKPRNHLKRLARPTGFEPVTPAFGGQYSIQLSYGRVGALFYAISASTPAIHDHLETEPNGYQRGASRRFCPSWRHTRVASTL